MDATLSVLHPGQLLDGRYRADSMIARGGMATVYLGTDTRLGRTIALKIAHPDLAADPEFARRFAAEARAAAQLSSPHVVSVYDQGEEDGLLYLAMEYVPGTTLRGLLRSCGALQPREALDLMEGILAGLAAAHQAGIVHRDVKPENVLLGPGQQVKVADFGLARAAAAGGHTRTGVLIGTAAYLAPEQVTRSESDARTDVYAAGIMLFEMLTGQQPFTGDSPLAVAYQHVNEVVPPPSAITAGLPLSLDGLVALATSRDPGLRPADAGQFLHAITEVRRGMPIPEALSAGRHDLLEAGRHDALQAGPHDALAAGRHAAPALDAPLVPDLPPAVPGGLPSLTMRLPGPAVHETLIVDSEPPDASEPVPGPLGRHGGRRYREPVLQRLLFSRWLAYLAGALAIVLVAGGLTWWLTAGQYTRVPRLAGQTVGAAEAELHGLGFAVKLAPGVHSDAPKSTVLGTRPPGGTRARHGSTVVLMSSLGPVLIPVPQVSGQPLASAETALRQAGLTPGTVQTVASPTVQAGLVISTTPPAGSQAPKDKPVMITVSGGPPLPNFVGQQVAAAQAAAQQGGYQLNPVADPSSSGQPGTIVRQSPAASTPVRQGEVVTVYVAGNSAQPQVPVPDVRGENVNQAINQLQQAGFKVRVVNPLGLGHRVEGYSPAGQAPPGTTITLLVGVFP
jgi:beta-lactam-binding protein with PASTA domain